MKALPQPQGPSAAHRHAGPPQSSGRPSAGVRASAGRPKSVACFGWTRQVAHVSGTCTMSATRPTLIYQLKSLTEPQPASNWPMRAKSDRRKSSSVIEQYTCSPRRHSRPVVRRLPDVRAIHQVGEAPAEQALQPPLVRPVVHRSRQRPRACSVPRRTPDAAPGRTPSSPGNPAPSRRRWSRCRRTPHARGGRIDSSWDTDPREAPARSRRADPAARAPGRTPRRHPRSGCR